MAERIGRYQLFGRALDRCESFIERRFLIALLFSERFSFEPTPDAGVAVAVDNDGVMLGVQVPIGRYRADFAMKRRGASARLAIELDGHSFHATPEAAERDRVRDRMLTSLGWTTIRFTGREIIQDALGCAQQAHRILLSVSETSEELPLAKTANSVELVKTMESAQLRLRNTG